jgi:hypothetical protein
MTPEIHCSQRTEPLARNQAFHSTTDDIYGVDLRACTLRVDSVPLSLAPEPLAVDLSRNRQIMRHEHWTQHSKCTAVNPLFLCKSAKSVDETPGFKRSVSRGRRKTPAESEINYFARVRAAFFAAAERCAGVRFRAALRACFESASFDAADRPSRFSAFSVASERFRDGLALGVLCPFLRSCFAFRRVSSGTLPFSGTGNFTPARLAFERPMAIACLADRAPCSPLRIASISSRTNSPACVEADFPARLSRCARSMVSFFGMGTSKKFSQTTPSPRA